MELSCTASGCGQKTYEVMTRLSEPLTYQSADGLEVSIQPVCQAGSSTITHRTARQPSSLPGSLPHCCCAAAPAAASSGLSSPSCLTAFVVTYSLSLPPTINSTSARAAFRHYRSTSLPQRRGCCWQHYSDIIFRTSANSLTALSLVIPGSVVLTYFGC